jgi:Tol biopolymer transport system component
MPSLKGLSVEVRDGNVYLNDAGAATRLTEGGKDRSPALSPDGSRVVFVRDEDHRGLSPKIGDAVGPEFGRSQLWICGVRPRSAPTLLLDSPTEVKNRAFFGFYAPQFSANSESIYFQIAFSATSPAIARLSLESRKVYFIADALRFSVIPVDRYRGDLIAQVHRPKMGGGYYDWFYLLTPDGQEVGVIGQGKSDVYDFLQLYVGDVSRCEAWSGSEWMTCIGQIRR